MRHMDVTGCKLIAEKASLLSPLENKPNQPCKFISGGNQGFRGASSCRESTAPLSPLLSPREGNSGDNGVLLSNQIETEDSCISREYNYQGSEEDGSILFGGDHENSYSQSVITDISSISIEEISALEVNSERNSSTFQVVERNTIDVQDVNRVAVDLAGDDGNRRPEMEDAVVVIPRFLEVPPQMMKVESIANGMNHSLSNLTAHLYGVYDGHGGFIHVFMMEILGTTGRNNGRKHSPIVLSKSMAEIGGVHRGTGGNKPDREPVAPETVGSTAVVAIVSSTHIIVANCGDSRAVLYRGNLPMPLSVDHKPDREDEHARVEAAGGKVTQWNGSRVFGVLAMLRSIGDRYLKPWVIPDQEVMFVPRAKEDECLILASDGLWDVITNEEACEVARKRILVWHKKHGDKLSAERGEGIDPAAQAAAEYLSRLALSKGSKDSITVIVLDLKAQKI
ncbi:hypothetical protein CRYUN_Cryun03dG0015500 [Craigia yunnanensis]